MTGDGIRHTAGILLAGWLTLAMPAAAPAQDGEACARGAGDAGIAACTREIESGKHRGPALAQRYYNRGVGYYQKEDSDRAIADFSEAIRLDPALGPAFVNRSSAYLDKDDADRAIADLTEAIRLNPKRAVAFYNRGIAHVVRSDIDRAFTDFNEAIRLDSTDIDRYRWRGNVNFYKGDYDAAASDLARVVLQSPDDAYAVLWLFISRSHANKQSKMELEVTAAALDQAAWPYAAVELFLGRRTPELVLAAARKPDERCEAQFYIGVWHVFRGDRAAARPPLGEVVDACSKKSMEYHGAQAELKRLGR
jgi:lipoprotein NlpI